MPGLRNIEAWQYKVWRQEASLLMQQSHCVFKVLATFDWNECLPNNVHMILMTRHQHDMAPLHGAFWQCLAYSENTQML